MPRLVDGSAQPGHASVVQATTFNSPITLRAHSKHVRFDVPMDVESEHVVTATELKRNAAIQARRRHRRFSPGRIDPDYIALHNASLSMESPASLEPESKKRPAPGPAFSRAKRLQLLASSHATNPVDALMETPTSPRCLDFRGTVESDSSIRQTVNSHPEEVAIRPIPVANESALENVNGDIVSMPQIATSAEQTAPEPSASMQGQQSSAFRSVSNSGAPIAPATMNPSVSGNDSHMPNFVGRPSSGIRRQSWRQIRAAVAKKQIPFSSGPQPALSSGNSEYDAAPPNVSQMMSMPTPMPAYYAAASNSDVSNHRPSYQWRQLRHAVTNVFTPMYRQMTQHQTDSGNMYSTESHGQQNSHNGMYPGGAPAASTLPSLQQAFPPEYYAATAGGEVVDVDDDNADDSSGSSMSDCAPGPCTVGATDFVRTHSQHRKRPAAIFGGLAQTQTTPSSPSAKAAGVLYSRQVAIETQTDPVAVERSDAGCQTDMAIPLYPLTSRKQVSSAETQTDPVFSLWVHSDTLPPARGSDPNNLSCSPKNPVANILSRINKSLRWKQS